MMNENWTEAEVSLIVEDYFRMLELELQKEKYNKSSFRSVLITKLNDRSDGSIEFKHQNISAILAQTGRPFIKGYKPKSNYQGLLQDEVLKYLSENGSTLESQFERFADEVILNKLAAAINFDTILETDSGISIANEPEPIYRPIKINYLEREQNNRLLGEKGESLIIEYEKWRLIKGDKESLADKVYWISKDLGDGTGFDILSKNYDGTDRFIEVKTTKLTKETPIFLTKNEISFASLKSRNLHLYRVFNFDTFPKIFIKSGRYEEFCQLLPQSFKGYFT